MNFFGANALAEFWWSADFSVRFYIVIIACFIPITIIGIVASVKVSSTFKKYSGVMSRAAVTGVQGAKGMIQINRLSTGVQRIAGNLTDHFDPRTNIISLSESVYGSASVAALGVACHEAGHAVQHDRQFFFSKLRVAIVPIVNFANRLFFPIMAVGMFVGWMGFNTVIGDVIVIIGLVAFGLSAFFSLITLPTEFDASRRAQNYLKESGVLSKEELKMSKKVLSAAAMTYVAAFLAAMLQFLRLFAILLMSRNRRR